MVSYLATLEPMKQNKAKKAKDETNLYNIC